MCYLTMMPTFRALVRLLLTIAMLLTIETATAQNAVVTMDDEPHYSRVFSNEYCSVYRLALGRLEQTKPIAHEHNWIWMSLAGKVQETWGGTVFQDVHEPLGYKPGYTIHFRWPVNPYALRNDHMDSYEGVVVELMREDDSLNRVRDASLDHVSGFLGPGDTEKSYVSSLVKTNVEVDNVQLLTGTAERIRGTGAGQLLVAITDVELIRQVNSSQSARFQLGRGEVKWFSDSTSAIYKNLGAQTGRFALLQMK